MWNRLPEKKDIMIEELLEEATLTNNAQRRRQIIDELVLQPNEIRQALGRMLKKHRRILYPITAQIIVAIGSPSNASLFRLLLDFIGDQNSRAWQEAIALIAELGVEEITPHLVKFVWEKQDHQYWGADVEGICAMLSEVDGAYASRCGSLLAYLLSQDDFPAPNDLDKSFLLDVLEKIGPSCAIYALPPLLHLIQKEGASDLGVQARKLMISFDKEALEPYRYVLETLRIL
jgi:hypothetical protein